MGKHTCLAGAKVWPSLICCQLASKSEEYVVHKLVMQQCRLCHDWMCMPAEQLPLTCSMLFEALVLCFKPSCRSGTYSSF